MSLILMFYEEVNMNDLDKNIDKLKKVVKVSTLGDTEKLDLIIFLDQVATGVAEEENN